MATSIQIDKAYAAYKRRTGVSQYNKAGNRTQLTKAQFIKKNYPGYGKTTRTKSIEKGLKRGGLSYKEIQKLRGR